MSGRSERAPRPGNGVTGSPRSRRPRRSWLAAPLALLLTLGALPTAAFAEETAAEELVLLEQTASEDTADTAEPAEPHEQPGEASAPPTTEPEGQGHVGAVEGEPDPGDAEPGAPETEASPGENTATEPSRAEPSAAPLRATRMPALLLDMPWAADATVGAVDNGNGTSTYTHWDGETVTYPHQVVPGEPIRVSGEGWLAKRVGDGWHPDVDEGDEGSVTGFKILADSGAVIRTELVPNPRTGDTDYSSPDVWDIVQAAGTGEWWGGEAPGSWQIDIPWPTAERAVNPPELASGDTFVLQLLSGTLYSNQVGNQEQRPDVSRTIPLTITVVDEVVVPVFTEPTFTIHPVDRSLSEGESAQVRVRIEGPEGATVDDVRLSRWDDGAWVDLAPMVGGEQELPFDHTFTTEAVQADWGDEIRVVARASDSATLDDVDSDEAVFTVVPLVAVAPTVTTELPPSRIVPIGEELVLAAAASGSPLPTVSWVRSDDDGLSWDAVTGAAVTTSIGDGVVTSGLRIAAVDAADDGARFKAVFVNDAGSIETGVLLLSSVVDPSAGLVITEQPVSQTIEAGESATFTASAAGDPAPAVRWQRSVDDGATWVDLRGATSATYTIAAVIPGLDGARYRAVFTNSDTPDGVVSNAVTLTVTPRAVMRETCGTSYGPGAANTGIPFCFLSPEKVVVGEPIVIEGTGGYLHSDGATGSVINFFLNHEYSGDPNGVYSKQLFENPATGGTVSDRRTYWIVQADGDGRWRAEIPWPTVDRVSPASDGQADYTQAELDEKFAPGTTHGFRMLTGSLVANDRQRGASAYFTVVEDLEDELELGEPAYDHQTFASEVAGDEAVAWVQHQVDTGQGIALTGTGWLTKDRQWGSSIVVRLQDETGAHYQRSGVGDDQHVDPTDPTIWQRLHAAESGDIIASLPLPDSVAAGDFLAVELTTTDDGTALGDVSRYWVSEPLMIDGRGYVPPIGDDATCLAAPGEYSYELAPGMAVPAANVGGTIRLTGENFCNLVGGGSLIAIKIDAGGYSHLPNASAAHFDANIDAETGPNPSGIALSNKTIWYVIEADAQGSFDVQVPIPTRSNTTPTFGEGAYTFTLLTRTISADPYYAGSRPDPSRSIQTPEFTVVAEGVPLDGVTPGKPMAPADPLHATEDLRDGARGGVTIDQQAKHWIVTVPNASEGDWVYINVFDGASPRFPWANEWFQVDAQKRVRLPLAGATLPVGSNKLSVQDRNGDLLGWGTVTVVAPAAAPTRPGVSGAAYAMNTGQSKPESTPEPPVATLAELDESNVGDVTAVETDGALVITIPGVDGGHWVYLYLYTANGRTIPIDWVQVGTDHTITVEVGQLPDGIHKLAILDETGALVGWVTANGADVAPDTEPEAGQAPGAAVIQDHLSDSGTGGDLSLTLVLIAAAIVILGAAGVGIILLRSPVRPRSSS